MFGLSHTVQSYHQPISRSRQSNTRHCEWHKSAISWSFFRNCCWYCVRQSKLPGRQDTECTNQRSSLSLRCPGRGGSPSLYNVSTCNLLTPVRGQQPLPPTQDCDHRQAHQLTPVHSHILLVHNQESRGAEATNVGRDRTDLILRTCQYLVYSSIQGFISIFAYKRFTYLLRMKNGDRARGYINKWITRDRG